MCPSLKKMSHTTNKNNNNNIVSFFYRFLLLFVTVDETDVYKSIFEVHPVVNPLVFDKRYKEDLRLEIVSLLFLVPLSLVQFYDWQDDNVRLIDDIELV